MIDGKVGFTEDIISQMSIFNMTQPYGMWKDTGIRLEGGCGKIPDRDVSGDVERRE